MEIPDPYVIEDSCRKIVVSHRSCVLIGKLLTISMTEPSRSYHSLSNISQATFIVISGLLWHIV